MSRGKNTKVAEGLAISLSDLEKQVKTWKKKYGAEAVLTVSENQVCVDNRKGTTSKYTIAFGLFEE